MWLLATTLELGLPAALGIIGLAALVFIALRFNREEAGEKLSQYGELFKGMRDLMDERTEALDRCRAERRQLEVELLDVQLQLREKQAEERRLEQEIRRLSGD